MMNVEKRNIGNEGRVYIRTHLTGANSFCSALLETFISEPGEIFTFVPFGTPDARVMQFERGGLLPENLRREGAIPLPDGATMMPVANLQHQQAKLLREMVIASLGSVCIVDDVNLRWSDHPSHFGPNAFGVGEEVYHLLTRDNGDEEFADELSKGNTLWHGVSAVCLESIELGIIRTSTAEELTRCAAKAALITCTAFDGEGFVAWRRTSV